MDAPIHLLNWQAGWLLILGGFVAGAAIGLWFHEDGFLGGYQSLRRRLVRLGHISLAALGMLNLLFAYSPAPVPGSALGTAASICFVAGGAAMPLVCFLSAWKEPFRNLFALPVLVLVLAVVLTLAGRA